MSYFVDSHAHIQEPEFDADREAVIERALAAGVQQMVVPGVDLPTSEAAAALAPLHEGVFAASGFHPHESEHMTPVALRAMAALLAQEKVVAVGEIGLDYYRDLSPRDIQRRVFAAMLNLASRQAKPVIIHCRDAWEDTESMLRPWAKSAAQAFRGRPLGVIHYYSSDVETALRYIKLRFLISIHTSVTHPKAAQLLEVAAALPLESLLIETDSPYGSPQSRRGKRNEPAYVIEAARQIAEVRGLTLEAVAEATSANARRLFGLPAPSRLAAGAAV